MLIEYPPCVRLCFEPHGVGLLSSQTNLDLIEPKESNTVPRLLATMLSHLLYKWINIGTPLPAEKNHCFSISRKFQNRMDLYQMKVIILTHLMTFIFWFYSNMSLFLIAKRLYPLSSSSLPSLKCPAGYFQMFCDITQITFSVIWIHSQWHMS